MTKKKLKTKKDAKPKRKPAQRKPHWTPDPDGQLGIAKSIAARFGEEIVEEEFYDDPNAKIPQI